MVSKGINPETIQKQTSQSDSTQRKLSTSSRHLSRLSRLSNASTASTASTASIKQLSSVLTLMHENPVLIPLYFARDSKNFGPSSLNRNDVYLLNNVEVLTMKELKRRQKESLSNSKCAKCAEIIKECISLGYNFRDSFIYVIATSILCFIVPLPLCTLVLYHQKLYMDTTAASDQFTPELMLTRPLEISYWVTKDMNVENQIILILSLPYYALSIFKLMCFYLNIQGKPRLFIRKMWIGYTVLWSIILFGWLIVILMWIVLGAVLNPVAVLAHSTAVLSSVGLLFNMWKEGIDKMNRLRIQIRKMVDIKLSNVMNKANGVLVKQYKHFYLKKHPAFVNRNSMGSNMGSNTGSNMGSNIGRLNITVPTITPAWAFKLTDRDGNKKLTFVEFRNLIENMNLNISEGRALKIFASSDRGKSTTSQRTITYNEFVVAFDKLKGIIVEDALHNTGLSRRSIIIGLMVTGLMMSILFSFLFLSVSAFGGAGSFGSTVRSAMALFASKLGDSSGKISDPDLFTINKAAEKSLRIFLGTVGDSSGGGGGGGGGGGNNANESSDGGDDEQKAVKPKKD